MKFGEFKKQFPELVGRAFIESDVRDDSEGTVVEEVTDGEPVVITKPGGEEDKDKAIAELTTQLTESNKKLAEMLGRDKGQETNITINVDGVAKASRQNPLTLAYLRRQRK